MGMHKDKDKDEVTRRRKDTHSFLILSLSATLEKTPSMRGTFSVSSLSFAYMSKEGSREREFEG